MTTGSQTKLTRIRKPRVHITYDLHLGDTTVRRELPLVVGILADLYGHNSENKPFKDRQFASIDLSNFDKFMEETSPKLNFAVKDSSVEDENARIAVELSFKSIKDFNPDNFIKQNEKMHSLLVKRKMLVELIAKLDGNDSLLNLLLETLKDSNKVKEIADAA